MTQKKKKIFPKIKNKLKDFLADESGKITKKDALGLAAGAALISSACEVHGNTTWTQNVAGGTCSCSATFAPSSASHSNSYSCSSVRVDHASGIVNGHYSGSPRATGGDPSHSNRATSRGTIRPGHASHGSHGSHGSRW